MTIERPIRNIPHRLRCAALWWLPFGLQALLREAAAEIEMLDAWRCETRLRIHAARKALSE